MPISIPSKQLNLRQPALRWEDACPTGNGSIGAMLYGHICHEQILINHESLRRSGPRPLLADVSDLLPELRRLLQKGLYHEANQLLPKAMAQRGGPGGRPEPYLPMGLLHIDRGVHAPFSDYERGVSMDSAEVWTHWTENNVRCRRDVFVSRVNDLIVLRESANAPGRLGASFRFAPDDRFSQLQQQFMFQAYAKESCDFSPASAKLPVKTATGTEGDRFWMTGQVDTGQEYGLAGKIIPSGGRLKSRGDRLHVSAADEILVLVAVFTNLPAGKGLEDCWARLGNMDASCSYDQLLTPHRNQHRELFSRCRIDLDGSDDPRPNEDLLADAYSESCPVALIQRMFDFGRYLLICSSRAGGMPANLQGIWNGFYAPIWESDYHNDENIQMNYWLALPAQLPETILPLFTYYESKLEDFRENARKLYGCRGILVPIAQAAHGLVYDAHWVYWTGAAGWLAQHFYDYYLFTGNRRFLSEHAIPWMKECLDFYEDFTTESEDGVLRFHPSLSPENKPAVKNGQLVTMDATMDVAICREVLSNLRSGCLITHDDATADRCDKLLRKLPPYRINSDGAICEWLDPSFPDNYHHRHQSHLYPVFPGFEITAENAPELFSACRIAVEKRLVIGLSSQTGWSKAHMANIYARLRDGDRALECLEILTRAETGPNLLTYCNDARGMGLSITWPAQPPFQIDANFGFTAAVLEMLVFSTPGNIGLLPALPKKWKRGRVHGIGCRGGLTVNLAWDAQKQDLEVTLTSQQATAVRLHLPWKIVRMFIRDAHGSESSEHNTDFLEVELLRQQSLTISTLEKGLK